MVILKLAYPNKDFNERLKNLSVNDQLDLVWISGSDVGNGPSGLFNNVRSERKTKLVSIRTTIYKT